MPGEVLVAFGTRHESTRGIAAAVADVLRGAGIAVSFGPVDAVGNLGHVRAAVLGSAVWDGEWLPGACPFLLAHERNLAAIPVWLFASGPLDHVPAGAEAALPDDLVEVIGRIRPRPRIIFSSDCPGSPSRRSLSMPYPSPAMSTCAMTQPPKISPLALQSRGMGMTLSTSSWAVGSWTFSARL